MSQQRASILDSISIVRQSLATLKLFLRNLRKLFQLLGLRKLSALRMLLAMRNLHNMRNASQIAQVAPFG